MEAAIGMRDPALKSELESRFSKVIGLASRERAADEVRVAWQELRTHLQQVADAQKSTEDGFWGLLVQSFLILLREGFEAMLVITALVATCVARGCGSGSRGLSRHSLGATGESADRLAVWRGATDIRCRP